MYRSKFMDKAGRVRRSMGYYTLNKVNATRYNITVIVKARDKTSAANKIKRKYKLPISASNLREASVTEACWLMIDEMKAELA